MTTIISSDTTDMLVSLRVTCNCPSGRRVLPIRMARDMLGLLKRLPPDKLMMTYRCSDCRGIVLIRARHLLETSA